MTHATLHARFGLDEDDYTKASAVIRDVKDAGIIVPDDPENKANRHAKHVPLRAAQPTSSTRATGEVT